jgi:hypothetical protein
MMQLGGLLGEWPDDPHMQFVDEVVDVRVDDDRVLIGCRSDRGEACTVVLAACGSGIVRLTLVPAGEPVEAPPPRPPASILVAG